MRESERDGRDVADLLAPPPLVYGLGLSAALLLEWLQPLGFLPASVRSGAAWLGGILLVAALAWLLAAERALAAAATPIQPWRPTTALVERGPYGLSRNPVYLGMTTALLAVALVFDSGWLLVATLLVVPVVRWGIVRPEERYLEERFGEAYESYRRRVGRWIGRRSPEPAAE